MGENQVADRHLNKARRYASQPLYTPDELRRRNETPWTLVQGVLAPPMARDCRRRRYP